MTNIRTMPQLIFAMEIAPLSQKAEMRMEMPADAIMATTAGRKVVKTSCNTLMFRYFKYNFAMSVTMIQDGRIHPIVAMSAPGSPAIFIPTKVAELMAIGPGVI